jgi:hypothetical protein
MCVLKKRNKGIGKKRKKTNWPIVENSSNLVTLLVCDKIPEIGIGTSRPTLEDQFLFSHLAKKKLLKT